MWLKKNDLCYHVGRVKVGLCLQLVFRSTCRALTRACPNTGTPCFCTFGPGTRTWPVFAQGGGLQQPHLLQGKAVVAMVDGSRVFNGAICISTVAVKERVLHCCLCIPLSCLRKLYVRDFEAQGWKHTNIARLHSLQIRIHRKQRQWEE